MTTKLIFGKYTDKTFEWVAENDSKYCKKVYDMLKNKKNIDDNRKQFLEYCYAKFKYDSVEKKTNILVFDTETTGLIKKIFVNQYKRDYIYPNKLDEYNDTRLVSLSYTIVNTKKDIMFPMKKFIVNPDNFNIDNYPNSKEVHKISQNYAKENGTLTKLILNELIEDLQKYNVIGICAHNVTFDSYIIASELYRYRNSKGVNNELFYKTYQNFALGNQSKFKKICTNSILKKEIKQKYEVKNPKLCDYAKYYLNIENNDNFHDSSYDTEICLKLLLYLIDTKNNNLKLRLK